MIKTKPDLPPAETGLSTTELLRKAALFPGDSRTGCLGVRDICQNFDSWHASKSGLLH